MHMNLHLMIIQEPITSLTFYDQPQSQSKQHGKYKDLGISMASREFMANNCVWKKNRRFQCLNVFFQSSSINTWEINNG